MNKDSGTTLYFTGIDIGTSKVRCVIGQYSESTGLVSIVGSGSVPSIGMRKGVVVHIEDVAQCITDAVSEASRMARIDIAGATININGAHLRGHDSKGAIVIANAGHAITDSDRVRAEEAAMALKIPPNYDIIQLFPKNYRIDGMDNVKNPVGMHGVKLEVDTHIITGSTSAVANLESALSKANIKLHNRSVSSLASAEAVLERRQKESGVAIIDIGAGTTNVAVLEEGEVQHVGVIAMGANHVTNDIAIGLKVDLDLAEMIKLEYAGLRPGVLIDTKPLAKQLNIEFNKRKFTFRTDVLSEIIEARMEELVSEVNKELEPSKRARILPAGAVFVGGGSLMPGLVDFARDLLEIPVKIGAITNLVGITDDIDHVDWATAIGLMRLDMSLNHSSHSSVDTQLTGPIELLKKLLGRG